MSGNTIVCNTLTGAVSEYTAQSFRALAPEHAAGPGGLYAFGGDADEGRPIVAAIRLPATLRESTLKQSIQMVYISMRGVGSAVLDVYGAKETWRYEFALRDSGQTRCPVGKGIRENYLGFGLSNPAGQAFTLDRVEILNSPSKSRRV